MVATEIMELALRVQVEELPEGLFLATCDDSVGSTGG